MKHMTAEIKAELPVSLKEQVQAYPNFMTQKAIKYRDIEKRSATLIQL